MVPEIIYTGLALVLIVLLGIIAYSDYERAKRFSDKLAELEKNQKAINAAVTSLTHNSKRYKV